MYLIDSINAGGKVSVKFIKRGSSLSALVPGQGPLLHRACLEQHRDYLRRWFAAIEIRAWMWANTFGEERPNKIFLVSGQTLTNEYSIAHSQEGGAEVEIVLEPSLGLPNAIEVNPRFGYQFSRASAQTGFSHGMSASDKLYSIFFEVIESSPIKVLPTKRRLSVRIEDALKSAPVFIRLTDRYFKRKSCVKPDLLLDFANANSGFQPGDDFNPLVLPAQFQK